MVREAKAAVPSAWYWAHKGLKVRSDSLKLARGRFRSYDPSLAMKSGFALRRIAPDAMKIDLSDIADEGVSQRLLAAMGAELGAVHASHRNRSSVLRHVNGQSSEVLLKSVHAALRQVTDDYEAYAGATSGKARSTRSHR